MLTKRNDLYEQLMAQYVKYGVTKTKEINIFGILNEEYQDKDEWNDYLGIMIGSDVYIWKGTCNPGKKATQESEKGAAHLVYGYQEDIWVIDTHAANNPSFAHKALCSRQEAGCKPTTVWRDINKDYDKDNTDPIVSGFFGVNFHRASKIKDVDTIGSYSAGCQVTQHCADFEEILAMIEKQDCVKKNNKYKFSYLLTNIKDWSL